MTVYEERELLIIGGGPAGLAAAIEARECGVDTVLIDERSTLGGQVYKQFPPSVRVTDPARLGTEYRHGRALIAAAQASGAEIRLDTVAYGIWEDRVATYGEGGQASVIRCRRVILAAGAYDRPVVFPGWTLPGVITAGGAHSLVKIQEVLPGDRILMVGSGPLLLAFAAQLASLGANVIAAVEAAPRPGPGVLWQLALAGRRNPGQLRLGLAYLARLRLAGVPLILGHVILRAEGEREVERAIIARVDRQWRPIPDTERAFEVDTICVGYGLVPSVELAQLAGCAVAYDENRGGFVPVREETVRTTVPEVLIAGDSAGIGGSAVALEEGRLAGVIAAMDLGRLSAADGRQRARPIENRLRDMGRFRDALDGLYPVGPGIHELLTQDTIVCRCEEITAGEIEANIMKGSADPNTVKNLTRAGMGRCQGRYCARQVASLVARHAGKQLWEVPSFTARPPVKPVPIHGVAEEQPEEDPVAEVG